MDNFDVAIIGGGPGGTAAAGVLASHDKKVAIIEDRDWGGACLNRGCVPTKLFLGAITPLSELDSLGRQRVLQGIETVNFPVLKKRVNAFVEASRRKVANSLIDADVHLYKGHAYCLTPNEIRIRDRSGDDTVIRTENIIFACGSHTSTYPGLAPDDHVVLSSTSLLEQNIVPKSLIIAGGGTIGVEMADFYYHMGTHVIIAEAAPQLAPTEDEDIAAHLRYTLEKHGVLCLVGVRAESLEEDEDGNARLTLADGATYTAEKGLIAAGRMPNTEHLDAENAGCALNRRGFITTDYYLQSSPNSWAIGDVNGKMLFAHAATHQGEYVARTILGLEFSPYQAGPCPYCLHGSMEIMHVGLTEREAAALGGEILVSKSLFSSNVISQARGDASGFVKVVWRNGEMAGIAAIGGCATQLTLSAELLLMGQYSGSRLNSFMVAHPTLDETLVDAVKAPRRPSEY